MYMYNDYGKIKTDEPMIMSVLDAYCIGKGFLWNLLHGFTHVSHNGIYYYDIPKRRDFEAIKTIIDANY